MNDVETPIATGLPGTQASYDWMVPSLPADVIARVRVTVRDATGQERAATSPYPFSIAGPADPYHRLHLTAPRGAETLAQGDVLRILWDSDYRSPFTPDGFQVELSLDGGKSFRTVIAGNLDIAARAYDWTVPELASRDAVIRVRHWGTYAQSQPFPIEPQAYDPPSGRIGGGARLLLLGVRAGSAARFV